jgi:hypothetical protein
MSLLLISSCEYKNRANVEHKPVENFIGEKKNFAVETYKNADKINNEVKGVELHIKEWSYIPKSENLNIDAEELPRIEFFMREKKGHITAVTRSFEVNSVEMLKSIYTIKAVNYVQKFGVPDCMGGGAPSFFSGEEVELMDIDKIDDPIYIVNCEPSWFIEMKEGTRMLLSIEANTPLYTIDSIEEIEKVEITASVIEEDKYLKVKNR